MTDGQDEYGLSPTKQIAEIDPPVVSYGPRKPVKFNPKIGLIGCGGISESHLKAYRSQGFDVAALADRTLSKAEARRDTFFPEAMIYEHYEDLLTHEDIEVVDVTPHPADRLPILHAAIGAGKHVLSQKPFVLDLNDGEELVALADQKNVRLAVNQNGRWAPHFSYMRETVASGLIGEVVSIDFSLQWDQTWIAGIESLESIHHLLLFDFGIHWFDIATCLLGEHEPLKVWASATRLNEQVYLPPALASAVVEYEGAQVRLCFNGHTQLGEQDVTTVVGTKGTLRSRGRGLNEQPAIEVHLKEGSCRVPLDGCWFDEGFQGTMGELLCAIEEQREPINGAGENLRSLALCFAAVESANTHEPTNVGSVRKM